MSRRQRAQVIVWVAVMLPLVFLPIVGLSMDAGVVFDARRELQGVADGAARVGGMQLDQNVLRSSGAVRLDRAAAQQAAEDYLTRVGVKPADFKISFQSDGVGATAISVTARRQVRPTFLRLVHVNTVTVHASSDARPCAGMLNDSPCG